MEPSLLNVYAGKAGGVRYNLAIGQLQEGLAREVAEHMRGAVSRGHSKYLPVAGSPEAREAVAIAFRKSGIDTIPENCIIGNGAKSLVYASMMALRQISDQLIWFVPGYPPYETAAKFAGFNCFKVGCSMPDFNPVMDQLRQVLSLSGSSVIVFSNPVNPTGRLWSSAVLDEILDLALKYDCWIISDETYRDFCYESEFTPMARTPDALERTITIGSGSKEMRAPGYRLGVATGPGQIINDMITFNGECTGCPSFAADVLAKLLPYRRHSVMNVLHRLRENRLTLMDWVKANGFESASMDGAYFGYVRLPVTGSGYEFADRLLRQQVGVIPGEAFGGNAGWFRLSYAVDAEALASALEIIRQCL